MLKSTMPVLQVLSEFEKFLKNAVLLHADHKVKRFNK